MSDADRPDRERLRLALVWVGTIAAVAARVAVVDFRFRDPDSALYSNLAIELSHRPLGDWIAPRWWGNWSQDGWFLPHPPGLFWIGATLIRLGAPAAQAVAIANFGAYLLTFFFAHRIGSRLGGRGAGWAMAWAIALTPVTVQYLIRGNLEPPLTAAMLGGMLALLRSEESGAARIGFAAALVAAVFLKGMLALALALFGGLYWLLVARRRIVLATVGGGMLAVVLAGLAFEWSYRRVTGGEGFWLAYATLQTGIALYSSSPLTKLYNLVWYLGRLVYFALPWSVVVLVAIRRRSVRDAAPTADPRWRWLVASALLLVVVMALFERKADRYIFPSYTLVAMAGGWIAYERAGWVRRWLSRPALVVAAWFAGNLLLTAVLKTAAARFFYRAIQVWRQ
jgi:4-amino-4-deoxy-L-arabinose transferase-like glycosyltransferase